MYRLSPSKIDNFRIYKDEVFDMSKEQLIERLSGVQERTEAMILGSDVHKFIETGNVAGLMTDEIEYLLPYREKWIDKAKEEWATLDLFEGAYSLMRIDMIHGNVIEDIKVSGRFWGVDFYEQSVQWKMYLMAMDSPIFRYHIFQKRGKKRPIKFNYHNFELFRYTGMEQEVYTLAKELIQFCETEGISNSIKDKEKTIQL